MLATKRCYLSFALHSHFPRIRWRLSGRGFEPQPALRTCACTICDTPSEPTRGSRGPNAFLVRDLLGHKTLAVTGGYVHRADDPLRTLSDLVGERIAAGLAGRHFH